MQAKVAMLKRMIQQRRSALNSLSCDPSCERIVVQLEDEVSWLEAQLQEFELD